MITSSPSSITAMMTSKIACLPPLVTRMFCNGTSSFWSRRYFFAIAAFSASVPPSGGYLRLAAPRRLVSGVDHMVGGRKIRLAEGEGNNVMSFGAQRAGARGHGEGGGKLGAADTGGKRGHGRNKP